MRTVPVGSGTFLVTQAIDGFVVDKLPASRKRLKAMERRRRLARHERPGISGEGLPGKL